MKKTVFTILLTAVTLTGYAQSGYDALLFSENNYEGTARTVAMGNAFTALGGDLGAVAINPAGSAVAGYSQFTITPALTISSNLTKGVPPYDNNALPYFEHSYKSNVTKFSIPNIGISFHYDTGRHSGLKSLTLGFVMNSSNTWCEDVYAKGTNSSTSFAASMADLATSTLTDFNQNRPIYEEEYTYKDLLAENAYDYMPWSDVVGFRSGIFSNNSQRNNEFVGATEILLPNGNIQHGGSLNQTYGRAIYGNKNEYTLNIGANISNFVYLGFNLGFNSISYDLAEYFREGAVDPEDFENTFVLENGERTTYFKELQYKYGYSASGTGVFGKFGIIVTPGYGLRIGAAISTPTINTIDEEWCESGETEYMDSYFNSSASSPTGSYSYKFTSPFRTNFGIAYTMGKFGVISADYEITDYSSMRYVCNRSTMTQEDIEHFEGVNEDIKEAYGMEHYLRVGAEIRPVSTLSLRAGYNMKTPSEKILKEETMHHLRHSLSFGAGFSSKGSFFADVACRYNLETKEYIMPYTDYNQYPVPEILNRHSSWKVLLTLGWRF